MFGLASLRNLPDIEKLEDAGLLQSPEPGPNLEWPLSFPEDGEALAGFAEEGARWNMQRRGPWKFGPAMLQSVATLGAGAKTKPSTP